MSNHNKGDKLLYLVWVIVFVLVMIFTLTHELESTSFFGITETREIVISSENSVEVKRVNVVEGQSVSQGHLLVELISPDLTIKINQISHQLDELKAQKGVNKNELISRISQLRAENEATISEINNQIRQLENQYNINKALTSELKSIPSLEKTDDLRASNPILIEIESLKQELAMKINPVNIQIDLLQGVLDASESPIEIQVERLEKELDLLELGKDNLTIHAQISGIIGSVNYKSGEIVAPHNPILTLHTKNPSLIKGYIYEDVYTQILVGMEVKVTSMTDSKTKITGTVVGVGSRIVEYPIRLRKHPVMQQWGREIIIKIPAVNPLILGEKVLINATQQKTTLLESLNAIPLRDVNNEEIQYATSSLEYDEPRYSTYDVLPIKHLKTDKIEASAILFLPGVDRYIVLSDDLPGKKPIMLLMDGNGRITNEVIVNGLDEIDDMESIAKGKNNTIYVASSLSENKKGNLKDSRKLLVKMRQDGKTFTLIRKIDLYSILEGGAYDSKNSDWGQFILEAIKDHSIDIEGMFYSDNDLYLGFKSPLRMEHSVILKIERIDALFEHGMIDPDQISIWQTLQLKSGESSSQERLSGMHYSNSTLFITGGVDSEFHTNKSGSVWRLDEISGEVIRIAKFNNLQPEGITATKEKNTMLVCFDQGSKNQSQIAFIRES